MPRRGESISPHRGSSKSPGRTMVLRSSCRGDCRGTPTPEDGRVTSTKRGSHHHHHHHHHHSNSEKTDIFVAGNNQTTLKRPSSVTSDILHNHGGLSSWQLKSEKVATFQSVEMRKKTNIKYVGSKSEISNTLEENSFSFSQPKTFIPKSLVGENTSLRSTKNSKYSDYSSGDDFDIEEKTDYTYARSFPDAVQTPNLSRVGLRSSALLYSRYPVLDQSSNHIGTTLEHNIGLDGNMSRNLKKSNFNLMRGLDYESDQENDFDIRTKKLNSRSFAGTNDASRWSFFVMLWNIVNCVFPISYIWERFWSLIYWIFSTMLLVDTWALSRKLLGKKWILLPLLILLLLLGASEYEVNEESTSELFRYLSIPITPVLSYFTYTKSTEDSSLHLHLKTEDGKNNQIVLDLQKMILNLQQSQKGILNEEQVKDIVRLVVNEEMLKFSSRVNEATDIHQVDLLKRDDQLSQLTIQLQGIMNQQKILGAELDTTKAEIITGNKNPESEIRIDNVEKELDSLKDNIRLVEETQAILLANVKNCCRNHTYDPVLVENEVTEILLQVMTQNENAIEGRSEIGGFSDWLRSTFVGRDDLDDKLASASEKIWHGLNTETRERAEAVAKMAAAAAMRDTLQQHEARFGHGLDGGSLSEERVRLIVRDAIALYDADKTGKTDFALESAGGSILSTRCSENYNSGSAQVSLFGIPLWTKTNSPRIVIQSGIQPGECWAFKGSEGYLVIQLSGWVKPTAFSVEHIPRSLAPDGNIDSALKDFSVYGLLHEKELDGHLLGHYSYDIDGSPLQYFSVADPESEAFPIVELRIRSNHGNMEYTCLYRFRVHGKLIKRLQQ